MLDARYHCVNDMVVETTQAPSNLKIVSLFNSFALTQVTVKWNVSLCCMCIV